MATTTGLTDEQREWLDGLRSMADWLEQHPQYLDCDPLAVLHVVSAWKNDGDVKRGMADAARALGKADKGTRGNYFELTRPFGPHTVNVFAERDQVCERVVIAVEEVVVEEPDPEALAALPKVKRTETREVVRWVCPDSILRVDQSERVANGAAARVQTLVTEPSQS